MSETSETAEVKEKEETGEKYLIFTILEKTYSLPSRYIGEIAVFDTVYPLPLMPHYVSGVVNRYSVPYALFDIGLLFYKTPTPRNKVLIFKDEIDHIAFLVDDVSGIVDLQPRDLLNIEKSAESGDLTQAVRAWFNWNGKDVQVLDVRFILSRASGEAI